jgi:metallophosphoesterase (TIGR00282 family)
MRLLFVGDVIGRPGRQALRILLPALREEHGPDLVIANVENAAAGFGLTESVGREILRSGVDVMTGGNHLWDKKGSEEYISSESRLVRPANYPAETAGRSWAIVEIGEIRLAVLSLQGRVFMPPNDCPFRTLDRLLEELDESADLFVLDFHAEATSEKVAMGHYADGRCSAVVGTHTHVPTADACILPQGTAFQCDLGMTGPYRSIIGMDPAGVMRRFLTGMPSRFTVADGDVRLNGLLVDVDVWSGHATSILRIQRSLDEGMGS